MLATALGEKTSRSDDAGVISDIVLVTVSGKTHFNREYTRPCMESWSRIGGVAEYQMISDGLRDEDVLGAQALGISIHGKNPERVVAALQDKPGLRTMRKWSPTWRHVIDSMILCRDWSYVVLIDTDVFVVEPIVFAEQGLDFVYNCDDIPGYRGKWYLPFLEPMVPAINPGFFLLRPAAVDLDALEEIVMRYFVDAKNYWWTRQSALSVTVARSEKRGIFDGNDVRVFSGNLKRSPKAIRTNRWTLRGNSALATDRKYVERCLEGAAVLHLAGAGKDWLDVARGCQRSAGRPRILTALNAPMATCVEQCLIAARMFAIQVGRKRRVPRPEFDSKALLSK